MKTITIPDETAMIHLHSNSSKSSLDKWGPEQIQPNAMDLKLGKVFAIKHENVFEISEDGKTHRGSVEIDPKYDPDGGQWYELGPGSYEVIMEGEISIGPEEAGWVITRSTLNRNGIYLTSGLYDSGYKGVMAGVIHIVGNRLTKTRIKKGTRIGQFLLFKAEAVSTYDGDYGTGKFDEEAYGGASV